jgi:hypothetical protein
VTPHVVPPPIPARPTGAPARRRVLAAIGAVAIAASAGACTRRSAGRGDSAAAAPAAADTARADSAPAVGGKGGAQGPVSPATLDSLEREARALAKVDGCAEARQCRTAPVGSRACGGPRDYLVYCALTTDSAALFRKLSELEAAEQVYNKQAGLVSTCEFRMPPPVGTVGGRCATNAGQ